MKIAVIGGGAAGMLAAYSAGAVGAAVTLFEANDKLGKKLFITGKGRCNVTNACEIEDFFEQVPTNPKFLYSPLYTFSNDTLMQLLQEHGLILKTERGGRVFPFSDKSADVISTLTHMLRSVGVSVKLRADVREICVKDGRVVGVRVAESLHKFDKVIVATGGRSYPRTGSDGRGFDMISDLGHSLSELRPSLIPLVCRQSGLCKDLQGISLKNVSVTLSERDKVLYKEQGEMLFTHFGLSGPLVLSASAHIKDYTFANTQVRIDLKPALSEQKLDARILRDFDDYKNRQIVGIMRGLYPGKLAECMPAVMGIDPETRVNSITREQRAQIVQVTKNFTFDVIGLRSIDEAIITRGGVNVKEVDATDMQSKLIKGLYIAGEMLDVDAYTGGYNLQIAFSTGYLAGMSAAQY